ncbi:hypothetical protein PV327_005931 [Microctonus hyperodae]|uniref:Pseudouridine-5'-phosphate glycosidase n=1 Tax=Microctonus hyperodae TaxID=165561 RepID=A0AA39G2E0_MICHY|nr:hypothetical protein PV327_005931 [Microctonus hyperodae]
MQFCKKKKAIVLKMTCTIMKIGVHNRLIHPQYRTITHRLFNNKFIFGNEVISAKQNNKPIVALESTIITHGMPYPDNFETAIKVEEIVRQRGAVPATIGIIDGNIHVGLNENQINNLAIEVNGPKRAIKCSQRDICSIIAAGANGGTTVGGTVTIAHLAGIPVMATGGIGGVHRDAQDTFDISSDLIVLGRTPVAVVCAGIKAILDIPKTLEFLETLGVPVMTVGDAEAFPAFYSSTTVDNIKSPAKVSGVIDAAKCINIQRNLGINSGLIFAVPIPQSHSIDPSIIDKFIQIALDELKNRGIQGKNVTPYLLKRVTELTEGKSLTSNKVLIENNARVAADIAVELSKVSMNNSGDSGNVKLRENSGKKLNVAVIGGAVEDTVIHIEDPVVKRTTAAERQNVAAASPSYYRVSLVRP